MSAVSKLQPPAAHRVTAAILASLARGVRPWVKPWSDASPRGALVLPRRACGAQYRGVNVVALWAIAEQHGYASPYWFTFKQALALGGQVRKGERGSFVVFYKQLAKADAEAEAESSEAGHTRSAARRILRGYTVFHRDQIDGLDTRFDAPAPTAAPPPDRFAAMFARVPADVRYGGSRAYYSQVTDHVQMPPRAAFADITQFYATQAHEFGHWTRHPCRLDRDFGAKRFGDAGYALEELVAELCAAFVGATVSLPSDHIEDHASYIHSWLGALRENPNAFLSAAAKAQLAADYLLHFMGEAPVTAPPSN